MDVPSVGGRYTTSSISYLRPVLIATSFYKAEELPGTLIASLVACADEIKRTGSRVVFYNDSPGYEPLQQALAAALATIGDAFPWSLHEATENRGFVRTMNDAIAEAVEKKFDLLLLNSDTRLEAGALTEMQRVASLDAMTGFVNPRSNNATITTLPVQARVSDTTPEKLAPAMRALAARLPRTRYIPTGVGFCLLIRWHILAEFGGFDEIYGAGYNEENDLVMRAARCGYRVVLANHALVWHVGSASFAESPIRKDEWERKNRAILDQRYPEYGRHTAEFYDSPETVAERLLACLIPDEDGRLDLALDFSSFRADFNGTTQAGHQLLRVANRLWGKRYRLFVICAQDVYEFHHYAECGIPRSDPHSGRLFAAVFRFGQPYDWNAIERLTHSGAAIGLYMLDTISIDCPQLVSPALRNMWALVLDQADFIATQSRHTQAQFTARFSIPDRVIPIMAHHSLDLRDYEVTPGKAQTIAAHPHGRVLVVGNHFAHKYVAPTANALTAAFPDREILVLGMQANECETGGGSVANRLKAAANLVAHRAGTLDQQVIDGLFLSTDIIVFPSHAEGFGFPVLTALATRKPLFVRRLPVFEELWEALGHTENMHFYDTTTELVQLLTKPPVWIGGSLEPTPEMGAAASAATLIAGIDAALAQVDYQRIVARLRCVQTASLFGPPDRRDPPGETPPEAAARLIGERIERIAHKALRHRMVFRLVRALVRGMRALRRN
jgi:GT2 family glycosyltransferase